MFTLASQPQGRDQSQQKHKDPPHCILVRHTLLGTGFDPRSLVNPPPSTAWGFKTSPQVPP